MENLQQNNGSCSDTGSKKAFANWTSAEEKLLIDLYSNNSNRHISKILNKSKASVDKKASLLGLKKSENHRKKISRLNNKGKRHSWTDDEISFLKQNYTIKTYEEIADSLNRTPNAVSQKARQIQLKKYNT